MLELGNLEYMFSPWRLEWARKFMKKHEFLRSGSICECLWNENNNIDLLGQNIKELDNFFPLSACEKE